MNNDDMFGKMLPVIPLRVKHFLQKYQKYVSYKDEIYLEEHSIVRPLLFGETVRKKLKNSNMIEEKQCKELENKVERRESTPMMINKWCHRVNNSINVCIVGFEYSIYFT